MKLCSACVCAGGHLSNSPAVRDLRRSQLFHYSAGISIGMLASLLILIYVMAKVMPKVRLQSRSGNRVLLSAMELELTTRQLAGSRTVPNCCNLGIWLQTPAL